MNSIQINFFSIRINHYSQLVNLKYAYLIYKLYFFHLNCISLSNSTHLHLDHLIAQHLTEFNWSYLKILIELGLYLLQGHFLLAYYFIHISSLLLIFFFFHFILHALLILLSWQFSKIWLFFILYLVFLVLVTLFCLFFIRKLMLYFIHRILSKICLILFITFVTDWKNSNLINL